MSPVSKKNLYDSSAMHHPNGNFMCYVTLDRANWYVSKNLAKWIDNSSFQLTFPPKGYGKPNIDFYAQKIEKKCVVCGDSPEEGLNKHHIVPYVFRAAMPKEYKTANHYDVVLACDNCHESYEIFAHDFKMELCNKYGKFMSIKPSKEICENNNIQKAQTIIKQVEQGLHRDKDGEMLIPPHRLHYLKQIAEKPLNDAQYQNSTWGQEIINNVLQEDKLFDFVKSWRGHFMENAKPQHMPAYWSVDSPLEVIFKD